MTKVRHITFGTPGYTTSVQQLQSTATEFGINTYAYTPRHPAVLELRRRSPDIMRQRHGGGYWLWKPTIILDALNHSEEGTVVMYTDSAMHMIADPRPMLRYALSYPIMIFEHKFPPEGGPAASLTCKWTKRDTFVLLEADTPRFWNIQQAMGGVQIYRNCQQARDFVQELAMAMADPRVLTDLPNTQGLDNLTGYRGHRHDQSVLTIIARKHDLPRFPDPTQFGFPHNRPAIDPSPDGIVRPEARFHNIFDIHRRRHRTLRERIVRLFRPIEPGNWSKCEVDLQLD